jgi:GTP-binding protein
MDAVFLKSAFEKSHYPPPDKTEVAFSGRSNVGKSSLLNVLVNRKKLARISSTPGRTQALNFFLVDGRFYFVDLPGYGYARVSREVKKSWRGMVEAYLRNRPNLKAVVVIVDIRRDLEEDDRSLMEGCRRKGKTSFRFSLKSTNSPEGRESHGLAKWKATSPESFLRSPSFFRPRVEKAARKSGTCSSAC